MNIKLLIANRQKNIEYNILEFNIITKVFMF